MGFADRKSRSSSRGNSRRDDYDDRNDDRGSNRGSSRRNKKDSAWVSLGSINPVMSLEDNQDYVDITNDLIDLNASYKVKVYLPKGKENITLCRGDTLVLSFKQYKDSPEYVFGTVSLALD